MVVVVVLLVPELFHGRPATDSVEPSTSAAGPEGAPVRSYTIDLRDSARATSSLPLPRRSCRTAPAVFGGGSRDCQRLLRQRRSPPTEWQRLPSPSLRPAAPATIAPVKAAGAANRPARTAVPRSQDGSCRSGTFCTRRDFAERMAKARHRSKGFPVEVAGPDDRGLYRVRSPPHARARRRQRASKQKMQASGLKPIVNRVP